MRSPISSLNDFEVVPAGLRKQLELAGTSIGRGGSGGSVHHAAARKRKQGRKAAPLQRPEAQAIDAGHRRRFEAQRPRPLFDVVWVGSMVFSHFFRAVLVASLLLLATACG